MTSQDGNVSFNVIIKLCSIGIPKLVNLVLQVNSTIHSTHLASNAKHNARNVKNNSGIAQLQIVLVAKMDMFLITKNYNVSQFVQQIRFTLGHRFHANPVIVVNSIIQLHNYVKYVHLVALVVLWTLQPRT